MPKTRYSVNDLVLKAAGDSDVCPRCLKKGKVRHRPGPKMAIHYEKKHPGKPLPDKFYVGPRDITGKAISAYEGKFSIGSRVKVVGFQQEPKTCPICGKERPTRERMEKHYAKKHKSAPDPWGRHLDFYPELEDHFTDRDTFPVKGTVWDVTPEGFGGSHTPAIIHVKLDEPIPVYAGNGREVYYRKASLSLYEKELVKLVPKR